MAQIVPNGGKSPEEIAYLLLENIADSESKSLNPSSDGDITDRKWILSTYVECLSVVRDAFYVSK